MRIVSSETELAFNRHASHRLSYDDAPISCDIVVRHREDYLRHTLGRIYITLHMETALSGR